MIYQDNYNWSVQIQFRILHIIKQQDSWITRLSPTESWRQLNFVCYGNAERARARVKTSQLVWPSLPVTYARRRARISVVNAHRQHRLAVAQQKHQGTSASPYLLRSMTLRQHSAKKCSSSYFRLSKKLYYLTVRGEDDQFQNRFGVRLLGSN